MLEKCFAKLYRRTILAMSTIGDLPAPKTRSEYIFVIFELLIGLLTFATVLGYIANIVTNVSAARKDFQGTEAKVFSHSLLSSLPEPHPSQPFVCSDAPYPVVPCMRPKLGTLAPTGSANFVREKLGYSCKKVSKDPLKKGLL